VAQRPGSPDLAARGRMVFLLPPMQLMRLPATAAELWRRELVLLLDIAAALCSATRRRILLIRSRRGCKAPLAREAACMELLFSRLASMRTNAKRTSIFAGKRIRPCLQLSQKTEIQFGTWEHMLPPPGKLF
jgi:hypothetical protein